MQEEPPAGTGGLPVRPRPASSPTAPPREQLIIPCDPQPGPTTTARGAPRPPGTLGLSGWSEKAAPRGGARGILGLHAEQGGHGGPGEGGSQAPVQLRGGGSPGGKPPRLCLERNARGPRDLVDGGSDQGPWSVQVGVKDRSGNSLRRTAATRREVPFTGFTPEGACRATGHQGAGRRPAWPHGLVAGWQLVAASWAQAPWHGGRWPKDPRPGCRHLIKPNSLVWLVGHQQVCPQTPPRWGAPHSHPCQGHLVPLSCEFAAS